MRFTSKKLNKCNFYVYNGGVKGVFLIKMQFYSKQRVHYYVFTPKYVSHVTDKWFLFEVQDLRPNQGW